MPTRCGVAAEGRCWGLAGMQQMGPLRVMTEEEVLEYLWTGSDSQIKRCTPLLRIFAPRKAPIRRFLSASSHWPFFPTGRKQLCLAFADVMTPSVAPWSPQSAATVR